MPVPLFKGKLSENSVFNPSSSLDLGKVPNHIPDKFIFIYTEDQVDYLKKRYQPWNISGLSKGLYEFFYVNNTGIIKLNGIGSPHACAVLEDLIFLGGEKFINIGSAGGLTEPGIFLCSGSLRDEGTSYHYQKPERFAYPDRVLTKKLEKSLKTIGVEFSTALNWTTDAPYRETQKEIEKYRKMGIATVDMEVSGMFSVAKYRKVKLAAAFSVSDVLDKKRTMVDSVHLKRDLDKLLDAALDCLSSA